MDRSSRDRRSGSQVSLGHVQKDASEPKLNGSHDTHPKTFKVLTSIAS